MLTNEIDDQRAWKAANIDAKDQWHYELTAECVTACESYADEVEAKGVGVADWQVVQEQRRICAHSLEPIKKELDAGRGFAILDRLPVERLSLLKAQAMYWLIGQGLGAPIVQNIQGTLLYDVRDTGQDVQQGARFSVTNAESSFHTDCAFNPDMPDYVGLLCINGAKAGGQSQLISAYALHNDLLVESGDTLGALYREYYFDRRGQFAIGERPYSSFPLYRWEGGELTMRYMHYYIEVGQEEAGETLDEERVRALLEIERRLGESEYQVEFSLDPGQMLFTNNHWILHNRTAFEDYREVERRRHYVRLWLDRRV